MTQGVFEMIFQKESEANARITSVHHLCWDHKKSRIAPRKYSCMSLRVAGDAHIRYNGREISLKTGDITLFRPGISYEIDAGREELFVVHFELLRGELADDITVVRPNNFILIKTLFSELCEIRTAPEAGYNFMMHSILYRIFNEISGSAPLYGDEASNKLLPAIRYLNSHFTNNDVDIATVAKEVGMSESYLRRLFLRTFGKRPLEYLNQLRIDYAKELLKSGYYSIEQVGELSGFGDPKYFSTVFKKYRGISPSEYRKRKE